MKNLLHKSISFLLVLTLVLGLFAGLSFQSAALSSSGSCGENVTYTFNSSTGNLMIRGIGAMTDYSSSDSPFNNQKAIKTVVIQNGVTSIGSSAFYGCSGLTSITIPDSVTSIGWSAFNGCSGLTSITIPDSVTSIDSGAFEYCSGLTSIVIPDSVRSMGKYAFYCCSRLTSVTISDSVNSIGDYSFYGCSSLTNLIMPCSAIIANHSFENCTKIKNITLSKGTGSMSYFGKYRDKMTDEYVWLYQYTPWFISKCKEIVIENGVDSIGGYAFKDCNWLTSITIPDSVTKIDSSAFEGCNGLKELTMPASAKIYNNSSTFQNCSNLERITLTKGKGTMQNYSASASESDTYYQYTPWYISYDKLKELVLEEGITSIGNYVFYGFSGLTSVTIPDSVTSIGTHAFYNCSGLTSVTIPDSVKSIGDYTFDGCTNLKTAYFGNGIESIGQSAFIALTTVSIPADKQLDFTCFDNCTQLQTIHLTPGPGTMADWSVDYTDSLWYLHRNTIREITLDNGIKNISESAFYGCSNLIKTNVPASVISIGRYAYYGCSNLQNITILSPNCTIPRNENTIDSFATIYGYENSTAQEYAQKFDRDFVSLGDFVCTHVPAAAVRENEVPATCTHMGTYDEVIYCSLCGEEISREQKQNEMLAHNVASAVTAPTCTHAGYTTYTCADCGYSYIGDFVPIAEHTYIDTVTEPTTESQGYTVHTCKDCGYSYIDSLTDILPSQMHYIIPSLADINTTITIKSDANEYSVTAENGVFELDSIKGDVYRIYAKQKNSLTVCLGEYDTKSGEVTCQEDVLLPLGDVNADDAIDFADLSVLLAAANYGKGNADIDLTGDGSITVADIAVVLQAGNYGEKSADIV